MNKVFLTIVLSNLILFSVSAGQVFAQEVEDNKQLAGKFLIQALHDIEKHEYMQALENLNQAIKLDVSNPEFFVKRAEVYLRMYKNKDALEDLDQAEAILNGAPAEISTSAELEAAAAQLELARQATDAGPVAELTAQVDSNPDDHQARFDLALALHANGDAEAAVAALLEIFRRDREWNDGAAKAQLFTIFDALKPNDPVVLNGRRKLSSMIFA